MGTYAVEVELLISHLRMASKINHQFRTQPWNIMLAQHGMKFSQRCQYLVEFDARANDREILKSYLRMLNIQGSLMKQSV